jgi:hypothetical protein
LTAARISVNIINSMMMGYGGNEPQVKQDNIMGCKGMKIIQEHFFSQARNTFFSFLFYLTACAVGVFAVFENADAGFVPFVFTSGDESDDGYGVSLVSDGDFDGDGYRDVAVGAWSDDGNGEDAGCVYLYSGAHGPSGEPDYLIPGQRVGERFGFALAAGDLDDDGCDELIVGAPASSRFGYQFGCVYIFFGLNRLPLQRPHVMLLPGRKRESCFGEVVTAGKDFNGDGYDDVAVGASRTANIQGQAFLYLGGPDMDRQPDWCCSGTKAADGFGKDISLMGDMNGDGYADLAVGMALKRIAPSESMDPSFPERVGKVFLFCGSTEPDTIAEAVFEGKKQISLFGWTVEGMGDFNADGYDDLLVGAPRNRAFAPDPHPLNDEPGHVYLYLGGDPIDTVEDLTFEGKSLSDGLGFSIAAGCDINEDGFDDIAIGAPAADRVYEDSGTIYVHFGKAAMDTVPDEVISGRVEEGYFGYSLAFYSRNTTSRIRLLATSEALGKGVGFLYD